MRTSKLLCYWPLVASLWMVTGAAHAQEQTPSKDPTVQNLASALYKPGYKEFLATRERLRTIAQEGTKDQREEATVVLNEYAEEADCWLFAVGNTEDWRRSKSFELPLGQGRIGGKMSNSDLGIVVHSTDNCAPNELAFLYSYGTVATVSMTGKSLTDGHLRYLSGFDQLELLEISDTSVSGTFLSKVDLPDLKWLTIANSPVRDDALPKDVLERLVGADFGGSLITNATIARLSIEQLQGLRVSNTAVNGDGLMMLKNADMLLSVAVDLDDLTTEVIEMLSAKESFARVRIAFHRQHAARVAKLAGQFPARIRVSAREMSDKDDYRIKWKVSN